MFVELGDDRGLAVENPTAFFSDNGTGFSMIRR
jgi:hypothetical protein